MPLHRSQDNFRPVPSTAPAFEAQSSFTNAQLHALQSTAIGRQWAGPSGRAIRLAESSGLDYFAVTGTSDVVAASTDSILFLGGTVETIYPNPKDTHISLLSLSTSTAPAVNITLGYGN